mgnify:CR=1 FL=1|jgi:hypothetical protein|tara:strand:+ start:403 stop:603 length:201 start_codon:yes stop_codon:yes gene_type:complete
MKTDIDFIGTEEDAKNIGEIWGVKITLLDCDQSIAIVSGSKANVKDFLIDHHYGDEQEVEEIYFSN